MLTGDAESGYGSESEGHLEEVKSLEDMGTGEEKKKDGEKEEKEGLERKDEEEEQASIASLNILIVI